jgi:V-type H+-transporting ATPase subunit e
MAVQTQGFFAPGIIVGTVIYAILGVIATVIAPKYFAKETPNITKQEAYRLTMVVVWMTTVCLWLFWLWTYMHQMIPLISPVHNPLE